MSFKRSLCEIKSKVCQKIFVTVNKGSHLQNSRRFCQCSNSFLDSSRIIFAGVLPERCEIASRNYHITSLNRSETKSAINDYVSSETEISDIEPPVSHDVLMNHLLPCSSVSDQMVTLQSVLRLTPKDIQARLAICNSIENMLSPFFHNFKIKMYGSSTNGFGCKGCDIDMSFSTKVDETDIKKASYDDSEIPSIEDVLSGRVSREQMSKLSAKDQLLFIHSVFLDYYKESEIAPQYINAYVPIVRFSVDKYNLKCDLSTINRVGAKNTKLLLLYSQLDDRVIPLVMTIRYWAKHVGLIGGGLMFNTYTVTLMIIYYLQTRNPPVLPSAEYILSISEFLKSDDMFETNFNLSQDLQKIPKSNNTESLEKLLRDFFFYYMYFDFTHVICPLKAISVPREEFCTSDVDKKFRLNTICVQDPLKLTHNVANLVDYKHCRKFVQEMLTASKFLLNKSFWIPNESSWGIASLCNKPGLDTYVKDDYWNFNMPLPPSADENTLHQITDLVIKILRDILLFKCEDVIRHRDICFEDGELLFGVKCTVENNTWIGRNVIKPNAASSEILEQERSISLKLINRKKYEKPFSFYFKCYLQEVNNEWVLHSTLNSVGTTEFKPVLGIFLHKYISNLVNQLL